MGERKRLYSTFEPLRKRGLVLEGGQARLQLLLAAAGGNYLFFDSLHPTTQAHAVVASSAAQGLTGVA